MKTHFHRFKNAYRSVGVGKPDSWSFCEFYGWLGSGITDKYGREIFEGDRVKVGDDETFTVNFSDAAFWLGDNYFFLYHFEPSELEVVGHVTEDDEQ